ncbi:MAG: M48 family metallopeptidase [Acidilobaceae archaeon]|nr:M48 family metallopeptidase [Acidilobaceae archaeon]
MDIRGAAKGLCDLRGGDMRMAIFRRGRGRRAYVVVSTYVEVRVPRGVSLSLARRAVRRLLPYLFRQLRKRRLELRRALRLPLASRSGEELLAEFSELLSAALRSLGLEGAAVRLSKMKYAWAAAEPARREVRLSAAAAVLPSELLEYLAAHEACHFLARRHDKQFWGCVARLLPDYRQRRELLKLYSLRTS